jgi:hypothetical protein
MLNESIIILWRTKSFDVFEQKQDFQITGPYIYFNSEWKQARELNMLG